MGMRIFAIKLVLIILGIIWIVEIFKRRHEDIETLKVSKDGIEKGVVIGFWIVTAIIVWILIRMISGLVQ